MPELNKPQKTPPDAKLFSDLRKLIEDELSKEEVGDTSSAFHPASDPLGLESPRKNEWLAETTELPPIREEAVEFEAEIKAETAEEIEEPREVQTVFEEEAPVPPKLEKKAPPKLQKVMEETTQAPPPLNTGKRVSGMKRILAGVMDQVFVLTLWFFSLIITLKLMTGSFSGSSASFPNLIEDPMFLQFAALEFATLWVCYLAICVGMLDMTFGMWVWGFRVGYRTKSRVPHLIRRFFRMTLSVAFYAPIFPVFLLGLVSKGGRNLLDALTGTMVYESA